MLSEQSSISQVEVISVHSAERPLPDAQDRTWFPVPPVHPALGYMFSDGLFHPIRREEGDSTFTLFMKKRWFGELKGLAKVVAETHTEERLRAGPGVCHTTSRCLLMKLAKAVCHRQASDPLFPQEADQVHSALASDHHSVPWRAKA